MAYGPDVPPVEREVFESPPLKAMLGQVRFPPVLRIADIASLVSFQEAVRGSWPDFAQEQQISVNLAPGQGMQLLPAAQLLRFTAADGIWSAVLAPDALTLEAVADRYTSYDDFAARFREIWEATLKHFRPGGVTRQALRYVDHIEGDWPAREWTRQINPELLGPVAGVLADGLEQAISDFRFRREDGVLGFKHGIVKVGPEEKLGYLLDFDYFTEEPTQDVSVDMVMARFDAFHDAIYSFFRWCVTDEAVEGFRHGN